MRHLAPVNPRQLHVQQLHLPEVTLQGAWGTFGIMDPFFFENYNDKTITVTAERYVAMLPSFLICSWKHLVYIRKISISSKMELQYQMFDQLWNLFAVSSIGLCRVFGTSYGPPGCFLWGHFTQLVCRHRPLTERSLSGLFGKKL
jgi:hypothetical protein